MWSFERGGTRALAWLALLGVLATTAVRAAEPASVIIVFDGSGSMWGSSEGVKGSKLVLARDAVRRGLAKVPPATRVGLASFGHRRGDCGDVEVLVPPAPVDVTRLMEPLEKLNPRGRGPLSLALREAAKSLGPPTAGRSLVLIHDDADNCQPSVCPVAEELRAAGVTVHVVGLGLKPEDVTKMACVPQLTGGRFTNTANVTEIGPAIEEALRLASGAALAVAAPVPAKPAPVAPIPVDAAPGLYLRAVLAPNGEPVSWPLLWTVMAEGQPETIVYSGRTASAQVPVAAGRYVIEAREGAVSASQTVDVADKGPTAVNLVLNAGTLQVRAQVERVGALLGDAIITISDAGQGTEARKDAPAGPLVAVFKGGEATAPLPAGRYLVRVEQGLARAERSVVVPAGSQGRVDVALNAVRLQVSVAGRDGAPPLDAPVFSVDEDDPDAPKGRREIARSTARQADFVLPPGTYYVVARQGTVEVREQLALVPGDVVKRTLAVSTGRLALATKPAVIQTTTPAASEPVAYRVERLDATAEVITTSRAAPSLLLAPGRYRVEGRYGAMNARTVREVEVKAGQTQQLLLEPQAATIRLRLIGSGITDLTEVFWDVRDEAGRTVWTTAQPEPSATLQAGRYMVRGETREKRYERAVELRAGEARLLELTAD